MQSVKIDIASLENLSPRGFDIRAQEINRGPGLSSDRIGFRLVAQGERMDGVIAGCAFDLWVPSFQDGLTYEVGDRKRVVVMRAIPDIASPPGENRGYIIETRQEVFMSGILSCLTIGLDDFWRVGAPPVDSQIQQIVDRWLSTSKWTQVVEDSPLSVYDLAATVYLIQPEDDVLRPGLRRFPAVMRPVMDPSSTPASNRINTVYRVVKGSAILDGRLVPDSDKYQFCHTIETVHLPVCLTPRRTHVARTAYCHSMKLLNRQKARIKPSQVHGCNALAAVMNDPAFTGDDAIVVSESLAKRMTAVKVVRERFFLDGTYRLLVKEGDVVAPGDGIVEVESEFEKTIWRSTMEAAKARGEDVSATEKRGPPKSIKKARKIRHSGTITKIEVIESSHLGSMMPRLTIEIELMLPIFDGDKLITRSALKGVARVRPDDLMPKTEDGVPIEVLVSPESVITRRAMGLLWEMMASTYHKRTGLPVVADHFDPRPNFKELVDAGYGGKVQLNLNGKDLPEKTFIGVIHLIRIDKLAKEALSYTNGMRRVTGHGTPVNDARVCGQRLNPRKGMALVGRGLGPVFRAILEENAYGNYPFFEIRKALTWRT